MFRDYRGEQLLTSTVDRRTRPVVYEFKKHDMVVTFTRRDNTSYIVQLALGSETRTFELGEFTDFWLTMIEEGRKATSAYLESLGTSYRHTDKEVRLDGPWMREGKGDES